MRDDFLPIEERTRGALAVLRAAHERDIRRSARRDLRAALNEAEQLLAVTEPSLKQGQ